MAEGLGGLTLHKITKIEPNFEAKAEIAAKKMGKKNAKLYNNLRQKYQEKGYVLF